MFRSFEDDKENPSGGLYRYEAFRQQWVQQDFPYAVLFVEPASPDSIIA